MEKEEKIKLERQYIKEVMEYFKQNKLSESWKYKDIAFLRTAIESVFKLEIQEFGNKYDKSSADSDFLLSFDAKSDVYMQYEKPWKNSKPRIRIFQLTMFEGLTSSDVGIRLLCCKDIFTGLFHEIQHHRQYRMTQLSVSSKAALTYAREYCLKVVLEPKFYNEDNYGVLAIENNAEEVAYNQYMEVMQEEDWTNIYQRDINNIKWKNGRYIVDTNQSFGEKKPFKYEGRQERGDVSVKILDELITPQLIKMYPILLKEYNLNGERKSAKELVENLENEIIEISSNSSLDKEEKEILIKDAQEMYYELIYKILEKNTSRGINEMKNDIGVQKSKKILEEMIEYMEREQNEKIKKEERGVKIYNRAFPEEKEKILENYNENKERIEKYYTERRKFLSDIIGQLSMKSSDVIVNSTIATQVCNDEIAYARNEIAKKIENEEKKENIEK